MPVYEYQCESCGRVFEVIQKFSDEPLTVDEKCGGRVHRLLSAPALQFKGSGWYVTDYAKGSSKSPSENGKPAASADSKPSGDGSSASSTSTSSTSETKPNSSTKPSA